MQERRHEGIGIQPPGRADLGNGDRMGNVGLAAGAELAQMGGV